MAIAFARYAKFQIGGVDFNEAGYLTNINIQDAKGFEKEFGMVPNGAMAGYSKGPVSIDISVTQKIPVKATNFILLSDFDWDNTTYDIFIPSANYSGQYTGLKTLILDVKPAQEIRSYDYTRAATITAVLFGTLIKSIKG